MKLKNKKTGEIGYLTAGRGVDHYVVVNNEWTSCGKYDSLTELNEEWEDYEEPEGWCVTMYGGITRIGKNDMTVISDLKEIGNYFNDKESAYDALDKIKAWKRLKDNCGISFSGINRNRMGRPVSVNLEFNREERTTFSEAKQYTEDLMLLFGGEE